MERERPEVGRPAPAPAGTAPAPAAPRIGSAASLLRLQRVAGNRAVLAALGGGGVPAPDPVVRRAWRPNRTWDGLIGGVRWEKRNVDGVDEFQFTIEDDRAADLRVMSESEEWHPADWWRDWRHQALVWRDELAGGGAGAAPVAAAEPAPAEDAPAENAPADNAPADNAPAQADGPVHAPAAADAAPGPAVAGPAPAVVATNHAHPVVASGRAPQYAPRGAYAWPVTMTTGAAVAVRSWVIQHVVITGDGLTGDFYEAFEVAPGATVSQGDIFQDEPEEDAGEVRAVGRMQHLSYTGGVAPPGMAIGAVDEADDHGYSSVAAPPGWAAGAGTRHELHFQWDDAREPKVIRFDTVPNGGDPAWKARATDLERG